jgi:alpha-2-macroglobulin
VLRVRLELEAQSDMSWVVVSDPVPGGATLLGSGLGRDSQIATRNEKREGSAWAAFEERSFEAFRNYFEYLPRGKHVVEYTVRLNNPGRFSLPPTRVEAMYAPETFGELPNAPIEVSP